MKTFQSLACCEGVEECPNTGPLGIADPLAIWVNFGDLLEENCLPKK